MAQKSLLTWIIIIIVAIVLAWALWGVVGWFVTFLAGIIGFLITLAIRCAARHYQREDNQRGFIIYNHTYVSPIGIRNVLGAFRLLT